MIYSIGNNNNNIKHITLLSITVDIYVYNKFCVRTTLYIVKRSQTNKKESLMMFGGIL